MTATLYSRHRGVEKSTDDFRFFADGFRGMTGHHLYMEQAALRLAQEIIRALKEDAALDRAERKQR